MATLSENVPVQIDNSLVFSVEIGKVESEIVLTNAKFVHILKVMSCCSLYTVLLWFY